MSSTSAALAMCCALVTGPADCAEVSIACGALGMELQLCTEAVSEWESRTGHSAEIVSTPNSATERLALYQQLFAAGADDIDVFFIDVVWPGILGEHFIDLAPYAEGREAEHFPAIIANNTVRGELKAMPWYTDAGLLYFRADLLEKHGKPVPRTWRELSETAESIMQAERAAGNVGLWGYVFQGRAYEGLTCNALEWVASHGGGTIVDDRGEITVDNPAAATALAEAASWVGTIAPPGVLSYTEEEARGVFQSGNALFMRNWPYAWALAQSEDSPVRGRVGLAPLPSGPGGTPTGTLGGWNLAVSRYSDAPEAAADLVMFLTSREEQKRRAITGAYNPTIPALYEDREVLEAAPFLAELYPTIANAVARPSRVTGASYNRVSAAFWGAAHDVLSGEATADAALSALARELALIRRRGW
jgi:trehalose/maltose transport system substrate-binding protein